MKKIRWFILISGIFLLSTFLFITCASDDEEENGRGGGGGGQDNDINDDTDDDTNDDVDDDTNDDINDDTDDDISEDATIYGEIDYIGEYANNSAGKKVYMAFFSECPPLQGTLPVFFNYVIVTSEGFPIDYEFIWESVEEDDYCALAFLDVNENQQPDNGVEPFDFSYLDEPIHIKPGDEVNINFTLVDTGCSNPATISGTISYTGQHSSYSSGKSVVIVIFDQPPSPGLTPVYYYIATVPESGFPFDYLDNQVCLNGNNYYPLAFLDLNNDGYTANVDPLAVYNTPVSITYGNTTDIDFTLLDPTGFIFLW